MPYSHNVLCIFLMISFAHAVHFRGGYISWQTVSPNVTNSTTVTIKIQQTYSWAYSTYPCVSPIGNSDHLTCISSSCANYVNTMTNTQTSCTSYDVGLDVSTGQGTTSVTLTAGAQLILAYQSSAWLTLVSGSSATWSLVTYIDLTVRSDNGRINSSPTSSMAALVTVLISTQQTLRVPLSDADSDIIKCRWANKTAVVRSTSVDECGGACQNLPGAVLYSSSNTDNNCTLVFTTSLAGYYIVALQIEDYMPSAPNGLSLSTIPLQFLVLALNISCNSPTIVGELADGTSTQVVVNTTVSTTIIAKVGCNTTIINRFSTVSLPSGTTLISTVMSLNSSFYSIVFSWTPTVNQVGSTQVYCTMATDSNNLQSAQYCLNFVAIVITTTTSTTTTSSTSTSTSTVTTTTELTTDSTLTTLTTQETSNLSLSLDLGLGLGLPLLLLLSLLATCALCRWYPNLFWKKLRYQFWEDTHGLCQLCRSQYTHRSPLSYDSRISYGPVIDYRQQYINNKPGTPNKQLTNDTSFSSNSSLPFDADSMTTMLANLMSRPLNKVTPSVDVRTSVMSPVQQPQSNHSDSFLVKTFLEQENDGSVASTH